ncbi:DUF1992 domain-containing protein [Actinomycetospora termitidis]|uniref:DUF1992 domain-containing protein n=1 Tax=Actinomycetospora termitidis TaxID=3053470 RepID=A0ABT7M565_9PSEU|nr:DUF1992 domain-containing protein [Actinomycetospora sp. Odt1-22]MDL5155827.1 DUF1992 domain-containing protein [Actinomycetospora sp. Odt1-22]
MRGEPGESYWERYESLIDEQIRRATAEGAFDDLPGSGKPLDLPARDDENWWVRSKMRAEGVSPDALLPPSLLLRKQIERLHDDVRDLPDEAAVRAVVADLDRRVIAFLRSPQGPQVPIRRPSADAVVERWRAGRADTPEPPAAAPATRRRSWWPRRRRSG